MRIDQKLRRGVLESLPEAEMIQNQDLREGVYDAWALSLATSGFERIEDIPASGNPDTPPMKNGTQVDHLRSVARLAIAIAREMAESFEGVDIDMDEVIAGGLCHDLESPSSSTSKTRRDGRPTREGAVGPPFAIPSTESMSPFWPASPRASST